MDLYRSTDMTYVALTMTNDSAHSTVQALGEFGKFHIVDLSLGEKGIPSKQQISYKKRVGDCQFWERKLNLFVDAMKARNVSLGDDLPITTLHHADVLEAVDSFITPIERDLSQNETFLRDNQVQMSRLIEHRHVLLALKNVRLNDELDHLSNQIQQQQPQSSLSALSSVANAAARESKSLLDGKSPHSIDLESLGDAPVERFRSVICGTIASASVPGLQRMLYRMSRGNAFVRFTEIKTALTDTDTGLPVKKSVFYVVLIGQSLHERVTKLCEIVKASIFPLPKKRSEYPATITAVTQEIKDKEIIDRRTTSHIESILKQLGVVNDGCVIRDWLAAVSMEKEICTTLMKAHFYLTMISLEGWLCTQDIPLLKQVVKSAVSGTGNPPAAIETDPSSPIKLPSTPPTHFPTNKFTETFQSIVDTYGVPRYKEVNPGLFTIISFPFLFGVMYGDIGHGIALLTFAVSMIYYENQLLARERRGQLGEIPSMAFGGRYALLMMGAFAIYGGIIYNDCMSIPLDVYGSSWSYVQPNNSSGYMYVQTGSTYPCGVDPVWSHKQNELAFYNSMKMKMAVILGVTQMTFGIILSLQNHLFFNDKHAIYFEFLPRLVFLLSTFGYMDFMIIYKWCVDWSAYPDSAPPNLIQTMIAMFLSPGSIDPGKQLYSGQAGFQTFLFLCAFFAVPIMLLGKPLAEKRHHDQLAAHKASVVAGIRTSHHDDEEHASLSSHEDEEKSSSVAIGHQDSDQLAHPFNLSDELIHNSIHTIEFVLGAVSNTASYLRLWALSLAHAELAGVFWDKMMAQYGYLNNGFMAFAGFAIWFAATFAVLLAMDVLECFLHALRLHWVEFQSKFYSADGYPFAPFKFTPLPAVPPSQGAH